LLRAGTRLTPQGLVAAAASDQAEVAVWRQPRVAILCCGDELELPGACGSNPDRIPESISYGVKALVEEWGGVVVARLRTGDDLACMAAAAQDACATADVVVSVGGASVGEKDFAKQSFAALGFELSFGKVAVRPGKPVWFAARDCVSVMGLPGNPTSAMVTARLFLAPLLAGMSGRGCKAAWDWRAMHTGHALEAGDSRETFLRASTTSDVLVPVGDQDSASQNALALATHLIRRRAGAPPIAAGAILEALAL
jgi:molybdopterin molybdotransferase